MEMKNINNQKEDKEEIKKIYKIFINPITNAILCIEYLIIAIVSLIISLFFKDNSENIVDVIYLLSLIIMVVIIVTVRMKYEKLKNKEYIKSIIKFGEESYSLVYILNVFEQFAHLLDTISILLGCIFFVLILAIIYCLIYINGSKKHSNKF